MKLSTVISATDFRGEARSRNCFAKVTAVLPMDSVFLMSSFFKCQSLTSDCRLALAKDPDYIRAVIVLGQTLLQREEPEKAAEYLEGAISKVRTLLFLSFYLVYILSTCNSPMFSSVKGSSFSILYSYMYAISVTDILSELVLGFPRIVNLGLFSV